MQTASPAALDEFLARFTNQVGSGFGLVQGDVQAVFGTLMVISIGLSGLLWALDETQNVPAALIRKVMLFGFFAWLLASWHDLTLTVVKGFAALGLKAGGGSLSLADLMNAPSKVVHNGLNVAFDLLKYIGRLSSEGMGVGFFTHIDAILVTALVAIGVILAFIVLGVEIAVTIIEFYIVTLIAFVMVPFGILSQTAFLAERAIGYVPAVGVKVMALALVVSIGEQIFTSYIVSPEPTWQESCGLLVAAITLLMLALKIPAIAAALITGGPQLSAGAAASSVAGLAVTVGGLALGGRVLSGGGAGGAGAAAAAARPPPGGLSNGGGSTGGAPRPPGGGQGGGPSSAPSGTPGGASARPATGIGDAVSAGSEDTASSPPSPEPSASENAAASSGQKPWSPRRWRAGAAAARAAQNVAAEPLSPGPGLGPSLRSPDEHEPG
ncbi:P-type conjugative transfer protein TrbL [Caulobacter segnis]